MYFWVKTFHLVFVIGWMACVFYLPRILVNIAEGGDEAAVRTRLQLMGRRLYRFGHVMFGVATLFGLWLWFGFHMSGAWLHAKLALVAAIFVFWVWTGRTLKRNMAGGALASSKALRLINEIPLLLMIPVIWLVLARPF